MVRGRAIRPVDPGRLEQVADMVGRWTMTRPPSAMSPTSTRVTPRGRSRRAEISAMERMSRQRAAMARCSTVSLGDRSPSEVVETSASISRSVWAGRVRPPVMA
jgi:hypothetical protein